MNLHRKPIDLAPKTAPNNLKKYNSAKLLLEESTDADDISVKSILPDEIPRP